MLIGVQVFQPEGTTTITTFLDSTAQGYTSTISASATNSGTVINAYPSAGYVYTTYTEGDQGYTTTITSPAGTSSGTIEIIVAEGLFHPILQIFDDN